MTNNTDNLCITKITLADCAKLKNNTPQWLLEFGDFDNIPVMDETVCDKWYGDSTWEDESWHNDACPSFASYDLMADKDIVVKIWSDYNHEGTRETECETQYAIHTYKRERYDGMPEDEKCVGDFIDTVLSTNNREDVFSWILEQERKNEFARREAEAEKIRLADLEMVGKRPPTFEDMQKSREFQINFYDAMCGVDAGIAKELEGEVGFTYFDKHGHIILDQKTGRYHVNILNIPASFDSLEPAERYMWDEWLCGEASPIDIEMSELDCLIAEYNNFLESTGLPSMSADELLVQTKPDSDEYITNQWQRNYLWDYINRWEVSIDLDGTEGRLPK